MTKIIVSLGAASLLAMSAATFAEQQLSGAQMDSVTAGAAIALADADAFGHGAYTLTGTYATQDAVAVVPSHVGWVVVEDSGSGSESVAATGSGAAAGSLASASAYGVGANTAAATGASAGEGFPGIPTYANTFGLSGASVAFGSVSSSSASAAGLPY